MRRCWNPWLTFSLRMITSGRGIGLAAVKARVQEYGGRVTLQNCDQGRGTVLRAEWIMRS